MLESNVAKTILAGADKQRFLRKGRKVFHKAAQLGITRQASSNTKHDMLPETDLCQSKKYASEDSH